MRISNARWILLAACFLLCSLGAWAETPEVDRVWTTVGSAGTLDEQSEGKVVFDRAVVQKGKLTGIGRAARQPRAEGSGGFEELDAAVIRYNVVAVDGLFGQEDIWMTVRYRAEGQSARVVAQLIEVNMATGAEETLLTFDSDSDPAAPGYHQSADVLNCKGSKEAFDFVNNAYYIEATLTTSAFIEESIAGIEIIQVRATTCP